MTGGSAAAGMHGPAASSHAAAPRDAAGDDGHGRVCRARAGAADDAGGARAQPPDPALSRRRDADPRGPLGRKAEGAARAPPRRPQVPARPLRVSRGTGRAQRRAHAGGDATARRRRGAPAQEGAPAEPHAGARLCACGDPRDVRGDRPPDRPQAGGRARPAGPGATLFDEAGVYPDLASIHFIARAITPPGRPRRFDTRFFAADVGAIAHRVDGVVGPDSELVELVWLPIDEVETARNDPDHQGGAAGARSAQRRRLRPGPAGAVLSHAAPPLRARGAACIALPRSGLP